MMKILLYILLCAPFITNQPVHSFPMLGNEDKDPLHAPMTQKYKSEEKKEVSEEDEEYLDMSLLSRNKEGGYPSLSTNAVNDIPHPQPSQSGSSQGERGVDQQRSEPRREEEEVEQMPPSHPLFFEDSSNEESPVLMQVRRRRGAPNGPSNSEEEVFVPPLHSWTSLLSENLTREPSHAVRKKLMWALFETTGGLFLFHAAHILPLVNGDGNEPIKDAAGYKVYGPKYREYYRSQNNKLSMRAWGYFFLFDGVRRTFGAGDEMLNILFKVEHRESEIPTRSNRVSRHTRMVLRGALDMALGWTVYEVHQFLMTLCPHLEEDRKAQQVGGSYLVANVLSTSLMTKGLITAGLSAIELFNDFYRWLIPYPED